MKICFFFLGSLPVLAPEYNKHGIGGEQVQHTLLAKALIRRGHEVSMVVADYGQPDGAVWDGVTTYKAYNHEKGIPVIRFIHPRWTGMWSAVARANADVYYTSCAGMQVGLLSMFCGLKNKGLIFRVAHDSDCGRGNLLVEYRRDKWLYEYGLKRVDKILVQSEQQATALQRNYGLDSCVAIMLVDSPKNDLPYSNRDIDVLWVNNFRDFKRPDLVLDLAERMPGVRFHIVGGEESGFEALYVNMQKRAKGLANVIFHGRVPYHNVGELYDRAKIFVNTSDSEGFPNSYLQSWRRGVPVVAFFDPDGLIHRQGLGGSAESIEDMILKVNAYLNDQSSLESTGLRCRAYMEHEYGEDKVLSTYLDAIHESYQKHNKG
jgi:glycosyltransferase involved in cell wall biosynthesis